MPLDVLSGRRALPSAAGGRGFGPLAGYIHRLGSSLASISSAASPGSPSSGIRPSKARLIGPPTSPIGPTSATGMRTSGASTSRSRARRRGTTRSSASLRVGVDFVKADDLCYRGEEIAMIRRAIDRTGGLCPEPVLRADAARQGGRPRRQRQHVAVARRPVGLLGPGPAGLPALHDWAPFAGPGHWPDPDMLPLAACALCPRAGRRT